MSYEIIKDVILEKASFLDEFDDIETFEDFFEFVNNCHKDYKRIGYDDDIQNIVVKTMIKWSALCLKRCNDIEDDVKQQDLFKRYKKELKEFEILLRSI